MSDASSLLWHYSPSLALCLIALVLFALSALWHISQLFKYRQKFFFIFVLGTLCQVVGYIGRLGCIHNLENLTYYIVQSLAVLLAPIFYAASIYSLLGKIVQYAGAESLSPIRPTRITFIFVIGDLLSFLMQSTGGGMMASGDASKMDLGTNIILIGLIIQLVFFFFFIFLTCVFHVRTSDWQVKGHQGHWKLLLKILEVSSALIFIRSVYRVVEYAQGFYGYFISHEVYLYVLDALLMLIVQLLFSFVHPGTVLYTQKPRITKDIEMSLI